MANDPQLIYDIEVTVEEADKCLAQGIDVQEQVNKMTVYLWESGRLREIQNPIKSFIQRHLKDDTGTFRVSSSVYNSLWKAIHCG